MGQGVIGYSILLMDESIGKLKALIFNG